jgi:PBP1b-binding outer membrane lipoprotein LpoB
MTLKKAGMPLALFGTMLLGGCSVADTAASVVGTAVSTTADVAGAAVSTTADVAGAAASAAVGSDSSDKK